MSTTPAAARIAYFSMEIALEASIPAYSGGLGVLSGDTLRSAADLGLPVVAVSLAHRKGYFRQHLDADGSQYATPRTWFPQNVLDPAGARITLTIRGEAVHVQAWCYTIRGQGGHEVPVYLLDTDLPENSTAVRALTDHLYGGDVAYRLSQEMLLGIGGVEMLRALGYTELDTFHMNEGHAALLTLALLEERAGEGDTAALPQADHEAVCRQCVFTTHTPVAAGHDHFPWALATELMGEHRAGALRRILGEPDLNMSSLALHYARFTNGVAMRHAEVSRRMFPGRVIHAITNGVHAATWVAPQFQRLFDDHIGDWRQDNMQLRHAIGIPAGDVAEAHRAVKRDMIAEIERRTGQGNQLDPDALTIGFARRATGYKRGALVFSDIERLRTIARTQGPIQFVYAGKAHPQDHVGQQMIKRVFEAAHELRDEIRIVYLEDYDMALAGSMVAGVDVWLNTPTRPLEASGTSGMKAALNGVPSLSVLDGWWVEGHIEGVTGWSIGEEWNEGSDAQHDADAASLYDKLEQVVTPLFYGDAAGYAAVQRGAIAYNGSMFTTQRMMEQYARLAYQLPEHVG